GPTEGRNDVGRVVPDGVGDRDQAGEVQAVLGPWRSGRPDVVGDGEYAVSGLRELGSHGLRAVDVAVRCDVGGEHHLGCTLADDENVVATRALVEGGHAFAHAVERHLVHTWAGSPQFVGIHRTAVG